MATRPTTNGKAGAGKLLRMPRRSIKIELEGDYEGFWVEMWRNPPMRVFIEVQSTTDFDKLTGTISGLIMDWNIVDFEGKPIPVGSVEDIGIDMIGMILQAYLANVQQASEVPKA